MTPTSAHHPAPPLSMIDDRTPIPRVRVQWTPPSPRAGLLGAWDRFVGPGATRGEVWLQTAIPLAATFAAVAWPLAAGHAWTLWQLLVAGLLALDTVGGVMTNATHTAKRWYHRAGQGIAQHLGFVALHVVQLGLVGWLFRAHDWAYVATGYSFLMAAATLIVLSPATLQKPIAHGVYLVALVASFTPAVVTPGLEWFAPVFFLKLFVAHLPLEAPLAPATQPN
ncbi:MAG: hypothetical protein AAF772_19225 [Acidobacteriota bacterium]